MKRDQNVICSGLSFCILLMSDNLSNLIHIHAPGRGIEDALVRSSLRIHFLRRTTLYDPSLL